MDFPSVSYVKLWHSKHLLLLFSHSVMTNSLRPHGLQHGKLPCPSLSYGVCSISYPLCQWCHPTISSSVTPSLHNLNLSQHQGIFQWVGSSHQVVKICSFSISPSNEYSGLSSFRIDWFDLLAVQGTLKSLLQHHSWKALILQCSAFFMVQLSHPSPTSIHDYWKNHSFEYMGLCQQSDISAF